MQDNKSLGEWNTILSNRQNYLIPYHTTLLFFLFLSLSLTHTHIARAETNDTEPNSNCFRERKKEKVQLLPEMLWNLSSGRRRRRRNSSVFWPTNPANKCLVIVSASMLTEQLHLFYPAKKASKFLNEP